MQLYAKNSGTSQRSIAFATLACVCISVLPTLADAQTRQRTSKANTRATAKTARNTAAAPANATPVASRVVAVVNGKEIPRKQLASQCLSRYGEDVLASLVNKYLIVQECQRRGVTITREQVDNEIATIAKQFSISPDRWVALLESERQISAEQYRRDIIWPTLALKQLVAEKLTISDVALQQAYESEYGPKVRVRMISASSQQKAEKLLAMVKAKPKEFGTIAKQKSEDANSAAARGLIPPIRKHMGDSNIEKIAFAMKPGEISNVIAFAEQFVILQCEEQIPATQISAAFESSARGRLKERLLDNQLRVEADALSKKLQDEAKIVNVMNDEKLRQKYPGIAAAINGQKISLASLADECIARHGPDVLEAEINFTLLQQALSRAGKSVTKADLNAEVDRVAKLYNKTRKEWIEAITEQEKMSINAYTRDAVWPSVALKALVKNKVKVTLRFRGREITHPEVARAQMERISGELSDISSIEQRPGFEGRTILMILAPTAQRK